MYVCVTFPVADFRDLHQNKAGRLVKPAWGASDPMASFARGFGSIHSRTQSTNGYAGENYYADCDNLIRYPQPLYLDVQGGADLSLLLYPIYRRFYFDGKMSGRFELGFRGSWQSADESDQPREYPVLQISDVSRQVIRQIVRIHLQDGRIETLPLTDAMLALRDGWLLSSTKLSELPTYDIDSVGSIYVGVGRPFVFVRTDSVTDFAKEPRKRQIFEDEFFEIFTMHSGVQKQNQDVIALFPKPIELKAVSNLFDDHENTKEQKREETAKERLARLFYTQIRTLTFAHSFFLHQSKFGKLSGVSNLNLAIQSMLERFIALEPREGDKNDALKYEEMKAILNNLDVDTRRMAAEIESLVDSSWLGTKLKGMLGYLDSKADVAIEAAASTATKHLLTGGP